MYTDPQPTDNETIRPAFVDSDKTDTDDLDIAGNDFVSSGDVMYIGPSANVDNGTPFSTTSTSYVTTNLAFITQWDSWLPSGSQGVVTWAVDVQNADGKGRLRNVTDSEIVKDVPQLSPGMKYYGPMSYTPTTTNSPIKLVVEARTDVSSTDLVATTVSTGVQL